MENNSKIIIESINCTYKFCPCLIVSKSTGVFYTAQCGGIACTHPEEEGFLILCDDGHIEFFNDCSYGCSNLCSSTLDTEEFEIGKEQSDILRKKLANDLDKMFLSFGDREIGSCLIKNIRFNFDRIEDLEEGWWPVTFDFLSNPVYSDVYTPMKGIIHKVIEKLVHA